MIEWLLLRNTLNSVYNTCSCNVIFFFCKFMENMIHFCFFLHMKWSSKFRFSWSKTYNHQKTFFFSPPNFSATSKLQNGSIYHHWSRWISPWRAEWPSSIWQQQMGVSSWSPPTRWASCTAATMWKKIQMTEKKASYVVGTSVVYDKTVFCTILNMLHHVIFSLTYSLMVVGRDNSLWRECPSQRRGFTA